MYFQTLRPYGHNSARNCSTILYVERSAAWLFNSPQFFSPLFEADKCFNLSPMYYHDTIMYIDPITSQTLN